jgi:hypothetical protein
MLGSPGARHWKGARAATCLPAPTCLSKSVAMLTPRSSTAVDSRATLPGRLPSQENSTASSVGVISTLHSW